MNRLTLGLLSGIVLATLVSLSMIPLAFPDKRAAITAAFLNRLALGLILGAMIGSPQLVALGTAPWLIGAVVGILVSLPDAIITKAYAPILVFGTVGGAVIGWVVGR